MAKKRTLKKHKDQAQRPVSEEKPRKFLILPVPVWKWFVLPVVVAVIAAVAGLVIYNHIQVRSNTNAMRRLALASARGNLMGIYLRLLYLRKTANAVPSIDASSRFKDLPNQILTQPSIDISFCRSFEFQATNLDSKFTDAARAYCSVVTNFSDTESEMWEEWERIPATQELLGKLPEVETQVALLCALEPQETIYIMNFQMAFEAAKGMGLSERALFEGSEKLGIPNLTIPQPYLRQRVASLGLYCP